MSSPSDKPALAAVTDEYVRLLSLAAHEFRTPASVVAGYLRMLQRDTEAPLPERQRRMVDEAAKSCARLVALITELSDIGKLDSGRSVASPRERFDLFELLGDVARNVHEAEDRDVRLVTTGLDSGAPIEGERARLAEAFASIFKAVLREQPAAITMACDRRVHRDDTGVSAVVVVAPEAELPRALDVAPRPFDEGRGGVGLSLPIARRLIEQAGGQLWSPTPIDSHDRGLRSAAVIRFPLQTPPASR